MDSELDALVVRLFGGDATGFFRDHWRKRPLLARGVFSVGAERHDVERFLTDLEATHEPPFVSTHAEDGAQRHTLNATVEDVRRSVLGGDVVSIKLSRLWHAAVLPPGWDRMRALFGELCRQAAMTYLGPARSEDCDLFLAGPASSLGSHFDTTDVFTLQLEGRRRWTVGTEVDLDALFGPSRDRVWRRGQEVPFQGATQEIVLEPGDALYVPAYCVHRVTGVTWSVALSLGLRAINELDIVEHLVERLRTASYPKRQLMPSFPETQGEPFVQAKLEMLTRVRALLDELGTLAAWSALEPLRLPKTLSPPDVE